MKIPTMLLQRVLLDVGLQLSDTIDRDYREICSRYQKEGMSFLTITLPTLDDTLLKGLAKGHLERSDYIGFKSRGRNGRLPALLSGFFRRIFGDDGRILPEPDVCAIFAIRQVSRLFKKVELPCSEPRIKAAYGRYVSNDTEVDWRIHNTSLDSALFRTICGYLWSDLELLSRELYCSPGLFGPGATAERLKLNERKTIRQWPQRAEVSFPSAFFATHNYDTDTLNRISYIPCEEEQPVRVVQVPKTLKTPRTISVEPSYMMLMQQSVAKRLMVYLESKRYGFQSIRFTDQSVNRSLARRGSLDGSLATIDLKDASDMVDNDLVDYIFRGPSPTFLSLIQDCRSTRAALPDGTILPLRKFASQGSALCFPIEAMVFFTIIMYALVKESGKVPSRHLLRKLAEDVAVYGDDIVVPSQMAPAVMDCLQAFGLKVNYDKSFHTGLFRESCGGDYYKGECVTPTYVRHWSDAGQLSKPRSLVAYVSLSNTLYEKGLWHASQFVRSWIDSRVHIRIPLSRTPIGVLHYSSCISSSGLCWDHKLHGYRVKGYRIKTQRIDDSASDMSGFLNAALGHRIFYDDLEQFKETTCSEALSESPVRRTVSWYLNGPEYEGPTTRRSRGAEVPGRGTVLVGSYLQCLEQEKVSLPLSYGRDPFRQSGRSPGLASSLASLFGRANALAYVSETSMSKGESLYTSVRPHALSLKRGWTASQAGLHW